MYAQNDFKSRESIIQRYLTGKCESNEIANKRIALIQAELKKIDLAADWLNESLEVEDYKDDTTKQEKYKKEYEDTAKEINEKFKGFPVNSVPYK